MNTKFNDLYESIMGEGKDEFKVLKHFKNIKKDKMADILAKYKDNTNDTKKNSKGNYDITIYEI